MFRKVKGKSILGKFCILPYETSVKRKFAVHLMKNVTIAGNLTATVPVCHSLRGPLLLKILSHPLRKCHYIREQRAKRISSLIHLATAAWVKCSAFDPFARPVICRSLGVSLLFFISSYSVVWRKSLFDFLFSFSIIVDFFLNFN